MFRSARVIPLPGPIANTFQSSPLLMPNIRRISFQVITPTIPLAVGLALALLAIDTVAWRVVSRLFDPERLITGRRR